MTTIIGVGNPEFAYRTMEKKGIEVYYIVSKKQSETKQFTAGKELYIIDDYTEQDADEVIQKILQKTKIDGILCFDEEAQECIGRVCEHLGFRHTNVEAVRTAKDKYATRELCDHLDLQDIGVKTVRYAVVTRANEVLNFYESVHKPCVLKLRDSTGSIGISTIYSAEDIRRIDFSNNHRYIMEEFIEGDEFSVEGITMDGHNHIMAITDKKTTSRYVEYQHVINARGMQYEAQIKTFLDILLGAFQIENGISHTEFKVNQEGIYLIETHMRPGGDCIMDLIEAATGVDPYELLMHVMLGEADQAEEMIRKIEDHRSSSAGIRYFQKQPGLIKSVRGLDTIQQNKLFYRLYNPYDPGKNVNDFSDSFHRDGWVMLRGESYEDVYRELEQCEKDLIVEVA